jgi:hypothetical protein
MAWRTHKETGEQIFVAPEWVDDLGDGSGQTDALLGVPVDWTQLENGEWQETPLGTRPGDVRDPTVLRRIWAGIRGPRS